MVGSHSSGGEKHVRKLDPQMGSNEVLLCLKHHILTYGYSVLQLPLPQRLAGLVHTMEQQLTILVIVLFATMLHQYLQVDSSLLLQHLPVDSSLRPQCFPVGSSLPLQHLPPGNSLPLQEKQTMCHPPAMHLTAHSAGGRTMHTLTAANTVVPTIVPSTTPPGVVLLNKPKPWTPI